MSMWVKKKLLRSEQNSGIFFDRIRKDSAQTVGERQEEMIGLFNAVWRFVLVHMQCPLGPRHLYYINVSLRLTQSNWFRLS